MISCSPGRSCFCHDAALNEWGSTVWIMEELAVAPLYWGFVFFGWFSLAAFGVSLLIIGRILEVSSGYEDIFGPAEVMKSWRSGLPSSLRQSNG